MPLTVEIPRQKEMLRNGGEIRSKTCLVLPPLSTHAPAMCFKSHQKNRREYGREGLPPPFSTVLRRIFPRSAPFRPEGGRRRWYPRSDRPGGARGRRRSGHKCRLFFPRWERNGGTKDFSLPPRRPWSHVQKVTTDGRRLFGLLWTFGPARNLEILH